MRSHVLYVFAWLCSPVWAQTAWDDAQWDLGVWDQERSEYTVLSSSNQGGFISPTGASYVLEGETKTFSLTSDAGYRLLDVGGTCGGTLSVNSFTTLPIFFNCTVTAIYEPIPTYAVTTSVTGSGSLSPTGNISVTEGMSLAVNLLPAPEHRVAEVISTCGGALNGEIFTTGPVFQNCSVSVSFEPIPVVYHEVTVRTEGSGTATPASPIEIGESDTIVIDLTPDPGFEGKEAAGSCIAERVGNALITKPIFAPCEITVVFGLISGTVPPDAPGVVARDVTNSSARFNLIPRSIGSDPIERYELACEIDDALLAQKQLSYDSSLIGDVTITDRFSKHLPKREFTLGSYDFRANAQIAGARVGSNLRFPALKGSVIEIEVTKSFQTQLGNSVIQGADGDRYFHIIISPSGKMFGHYFDGESAFEIRPSGRSHKIAVGHEGGISYQYDDPGFTNPSRPFWAIKPATNMRSQGYISQDFSVISALILVDSQIVDNEEERAVADYYITVTNTALLNSDVNVVLSLAAIEEFTPNMESMSSALRDIRCGKDTCYMNDPLNTQVAVFREAHQADLVIQMVSYGTENACGRAFVADSLNPGDLKSTYSLSVNAINASDPNRICGSDVVAHEIGHNMGLLHDIAQYQDDEREPMIEGGRGYLLPDNPQNQGTIMAYGRSVYQYSDPTASLRDQPLGTTEQPHPANAVAALEAVRQNYASIYNDSNDQLIPDTPVLRNVRQRGRDIEISFDAVSAPVGTPVFGTTSGLRILGYAAVCGDETEVSLTSPILLRGFETDQTYECELFSFTPYAASTPTSATEIYLSPLQLEVYAKSSGNGDISPSGFVEATERSQLSFTLSPHEDYQIAGVSGSCTGSRIEDVFTTAPLTDDCSVTAHFEPLPRFIVAPSASSGGSISPSTKQSVVKGKTTSFSLIPDDGFFLERVGGSCNGVLTNLSYTIEPATTDCTVIARFEPIPIVEYPVEITIVGNGSVEPESIGEIEEGTTFELTAIPEAGWEFDAFTSSCGGSTQGNIYVSPPLNSACQITVRFKPIEWLISVNAGPNGSVSPPGDVLVRDGESRTFTINPDADFAVDGVENSCGGELVGFELVTDPILNDCTIAVSFAPLPPTTYEITGSIAGNGYLSPELPIRLTEGDSFTFRVKALPDNRLVSIQGCGGQLTGDIYQVDLISSDCQIDANFEQYRWKSSGLQLNAVFSDLPESTPFVCTASAFSLAGKSRTETKTRFTTMSGLDVDTDGDGVPNGEDNCPSLSNSQQLDNDLDMQGDICDRDDDNDGVEDDLDAFPFNPSENADTDSDGIGDNEDSDDDGDGFSDEEEITAGSDPLNYRSTPDDVGGGLPVWLIFMATQNR